MTTWIGSLRSAGLVPPESDAVTVSWILSPRSKCCADSTGEFPPTTLLLTRHAYSKAMASPSGSIATGLAVTSRFAVTSPSGSITTPCSTGTVLPTRTVARTGALCSFPSRANAVTSMTPPLPMFTTCKEELLPSTKRPFTRHW